MENKWTSEKIKENFLSINDILEKALICHDYETSKKIEYELVDLFKIMEEDRNLAQEVLPHLMNTNKIITKLKGATYCLSLNMYVERAVIELEKIAFGNSSQVLAFEAETTLKFWRQDGYFKIYPEQAVICFD